jgi:hypothetical protein
MTMLLPTWNAQANPYASEVMTFCYEVTLMNDCIPPRQLFFEPNSDNAIHQLGLGFDTLEGLPAATYKLSESDEEDTFASHHYYPYTTDREVRMARKIIPDVMM